MMRRATILPCFFLMSLLSSRAVAATLEYVRTVDQRAGRVVIRLDSPVAFDGDDLENFAQVSHYTVQIDGASGLSNEHPVRVGFETDFVDMALQCAGITLDLGTLIASRRSVTVKVELSAAATAKLQTGSSLLGPTKIDLGTEKVVRLTSRLLDVDVDLSRLEEEGQDGAIQYDTKLAYFFPGRRADFHADMTARGISHFLDASDAADSVPDGSTALGAAFGLVGGAFGFLGGVDLVGHAEFANAPRSRVRTASYGGSLSIFPRVDRLIASVAEVLQAKTVNFPPRLKFFADYVTEVDDGGAFYAGDGGRIGAEFEWRAEISEEMFFKVDWRWTQFADAPIEGSSDKDFNYLDISANFEFMQGRSFFVRHTKGELAPIYERDDIVTAGFRFDIIKQD